MPATKMINIRIPAGLRKELDELSKEDDIPVSDIVRISLRKFISVRRFKHLHSKTVRYARKAGLVTEDDILSLS